MEIKIHCKYDELINPNSLKAHPKNRNHHGQDQIDRLAEMYKFHGVRHAIIVSKRSGFIAAGHGRKLAALRAGIKEFPVVYQDFESDDAEYAFIQSDNAIALWAELDYGAINKDMYDLGPFDIAMLGIRNFTVDAAEKFDPTKEWSEMPEFDQPDITSHRRLIVHFESDEDFDRFFKVISQSYTDKTKYIWFPEQIKNETESKRY